MDDAQLAGGEVDASSRPVGSGELSGRALGREEVVGTELAGQAVEVIDAIGLQDNRIKEITEWS